LTEKGTYFVKTTESIFLAVTILLTCNVAFGGLVFNEADLDSSGTVDAGEFAAAMHQKHKQLDKNQDGHLDESEYSQVIYPAVDCK